MPLVFLGIAIGSVATFAIAGWLRKGKPVNQS